MKHVLASAKKYGVYLAVKFGDTNAGDANVADTNAGGGRGFVTLPLYALGVLPTPEERLIVLEVSIGLPREGL